MRIAGVTVPDNKQLEYALTAVFGVGRTRAREALASVKIDFDKKASDLSADEELNLRKAIEEGYTIEGELRRETSTNIKRLKDIQAYRGMRHAKNLPGRGQRTKTNSRTVRGNVRKTMSSGKRKLEKK